MCVKDSIPNDLIPDEDVCPETGENLVTDKDPSGRPIKVFSCQGDKFRKYCIYSRAVILTPYIKIAACIFKKEEK